MECGVNALPWDKHVELRNFVRWTEDPDHQSILTLCTIDHLLHLEEALNLSLGKYSIVIRSFNEDISCLKIPWIQQVEEFLASFCMSNLLSCLS